MLKAGSSKLLVTRAIAVILILIILPAVTSAEASDPFAETRDRLESISTEEKEVLQSLFTMSQELELMEAEERLLASEIDNINKEIKTLETAIAEGRQTYRKRQESLERVLKSYQRMGPGSFIEIVLDSDSVGTFLQRLNILRELTRNTGELLDQLEADKGRMATEKEKLSRKLLLAEEKREQSQATIAKKLQLIEEQEAYLASLKGEKERFQGYLKSIEKMWGEIKPLFSDAASEFSRIMREGKLPSEALELTFSLFSAKGAIEDKVINKVLSEQSTLPEMRFEFHQDSVVISLPEYSLELSGTFTVSEGHILRFQPQNGSFAGMPLEPGSIDELFREGGLFLDLEPLLAGNKIHQLELKEGYIELISKFGVN